MFYIVFGQRYFPLDLKNASLMLLMMIGNGFFATSLGLSNILYGAYSIMLSSLISQFFYFSVLCFLFLMPVRRKKFFFYTNPAYFMVPFLAAVFTGMLIYVFLEPAIVKFHEEGALALRLVYLAVFCSNLYYSTSDYFKNNMFVYDNEEVRYIRDGVLTDWALPIILFLLTSVTASIIIAAVVQ
jgi:hypothetical protein